MAKKEAKEADNFTERICREVEADYGKEIMVVGQSVVDKPRMVIPISPSMDIITSGGILEGSWVGITGNPKTTKTNLALCIAATCQRPEYGGRKVYYGKVEGRLSVQHLKGIRGLDLDNLQIIQSRKGKILTAQDYLRIFEKIIKTEERCVLIIDSVSALVDEREMEGGVGTETRGSGAKLMSQWIATMSNVVPVNDTIVIGITHLMSNTSGMGAQYVEKATRRWHYQCDYQLRTISKEAWKAGESQIGYKVKWVCKNSPLGPPDMTVESYVRFGVGVDRLFEVFNFGVAAGLIRKSGSWYSLDYLGGDMIPKGQGGEGVYQLLTENPEWAKVLQDKVFAMAGGLTGADS